MKLRAKGASLWDPSFPKASNGCTFDPDEIMAWRAAKSTSINPQPVTANPPTVTPAVAGEGIFK